MRAPSFPLSRLEIHDLGPIHEGDVEGPGIRIPCEAGVQLGMSLRVRCAARCTAVCISLVGDEEPTYGTSASRPILSEPQSTCTKKVYMSKK